MKFAHIPMFSRVSVVYKNRRLFVQKIPEINGKNAVGINGKYHRVGLAKPVK